MNETTELEAENGDPVLLKFYTRKVFSRIRPREKTKRIFDPSRTKHDE
jgi:hypothetical protein